jgi:ankyrin repeat protein
MGGTAIRALFDEIASGDVATARRRIGKTPNLVICPLEEADGYFLAAIHHSIGGGDTALHVAAAAYRLEVAETLVGHGADVRARNRRGAEPLHYAADGRPGAADWDPVAQGEVIAYLIRAGAAPNATNKSGVAPLHRAVRTRSSSAVSSLIANGADPRLKNRAGSTPLHLAVQNTGKSNSGSDAAKREQRMIIALLLEHGASPADVDAKGKTAAAAATSAWIRELLGTT